MYMSNYLNNISNNSNNSNINNLSENDFVYYTEKNNENGIQSGGFKLNSSLLNDQIPIMQTNNKNMIGGSINNNNNNNNNNSNNNNNISSIFQNFVVPIGLFKSPINQMGGNIEKENYQPKNKNQDLDIDINNTKIIDEDIYNKLLKIIEVDGKPIRIQTRKNRKRNTTETNKSNNTNNTNIKINTIKTTKKQKI